jgi:hypothetical protein
MSDPEQVRIPPLCDIHLSRMVYTGYRFDNIQLTGTGYKCADCNRWYESYPGYYDDVSGRSNFHIQFQRRCTNDTLAMYIESADKDTLTWVCPTHNCENRKTSYRIAISVGNLGNGLVERDVVDILRRKLDPPEPGWRISVLGSADNDDWVLKLYDASGAHIASHNYAAVQSGEAIVRFANWVMDRMAPSQPTSS